MYKPLLFLLVFSFSSLNIFSQCNEISEPKVLVVGDSWAQFLNTFQTFNDVLKKWGFSNYKFVSNSTIAENGAQTNDFFKPNKQAEILRLLQANPSIEVVHLSIGGNDMLGDWKKSFSQGKTDTMMTEVLGRVDSIVRFIKSCKPGIRIVWSGYVYPNFGEILSGPLAFINPYNDTWVKMESPSFLEINTILNDVSARMEVYAANDPQVDFINATGLMQYVYGQTSALGVPPGGTYPPLSVTLPLGDPNYPSPKSSLLLGNDCYHLSDPGYEVLISYHTQKFYHKFLMDDLHPLSENNAETGTVTSLNNVSDSLFLGEEGGEQFTTVLSFNTTGMADTTLARANIFLRRKALTGTNPVSGSLDVKVKSGNFGTTVNVEAADFTALGDASATPCLFGSNSADGEWIRLDLPTSLLQHINNTASTQFIISAPGFTGGKMNFYNSSDPDFAPVLNLDYNYSPFTDVAELVPTHFSIYPNPTNDHLIITNDGDPILQVEVVDLLGKIVLKPELNGNSIDLSSLPSSMYILNITTSKGTASERVFKY